MIDFGMARIFPNIWKKNVEILIDALSFWSNGTEFRTFVWKNVEKTANVVLIETF